MSRPRHPVALALIVLAMTALSVAPCAARDKTDVVALVNGDVLHGEVKELTAGRLRLSTDSMDSVSIEWKDVAWVESGYYFQLENVSGQVMFGTLARSDKDGVVRIVSLTGPVEVSHDRLVRITPIEKAWKDRWNGSLSLGFSYTKASDVTTYNLGSSATYRVRKYQINLSVDSTLTAQPDQPTSSRNDSYVGYQRFRKNRWHNSWIGGAQTNSELGLDLRLYSGALGGRNVIQTNATQLALAAGLIVTQESYAGDESGQANLEMILNLSHNYARYDTPKASVQNLVSLYPGLSDFGRIRAEASSKLRYEVVKDFFLEFSGYLSYDNEPASDEAQGDADYGVTAGVAWSF